MDVGFWLARGPIRSLVKLVALTGAPGTGLAQRPPKYLRSAVALVEVPGQGCESQAGAYLADGAAEGDQEVMKFMTSHGVRKVIS